MRTTMLSVVLLASTACGGSQLDMQWASDPAEDGSGAVLIVPNLDDDNEDGEVDWSTPLRVDGENDLATVTITNKARKTTLRLEGADDRVRVMYNGTVVMGPNLATSWSLPDRKRKDVVTIQLEAETWGDLGELVLQDDGSGDEVRLALHGSPPTMGHHLLETREVYVVSLDFFGIDNVSMVQDLQVLLGNQLVIAPGPEYRDDPWMQDEPEWFNLWSPDSDTIRILDSVRDGNGDGGLDPFPETLAGSDVSVMVHGNAGKVSTFDAFGNLEVSPPVSVDGVEYPLGRIYYGWDGQPSDRFEFGLQSEVRDFLDGLEVQKPFAVDTSWLCVGHIDEFTTFLPDPTAPRGFRFLIADTALGLQTLQTKDDDFGTGVHGRRRGLGHGRPTIGSYVNDEALIAYNEDIQRDHIEPVLQVFIEELALTDDEIVRVPAFFEEEIDDFGVCGALAVIPGNVNLLMVTDANGEGGVAIMPDPFVRPTDASPDEDPFVQAWRDLMPDTVRPEFVDDWNIYHMGGGEVHCGTNTDRAAALSTVDLESWIATEVAP